MKIFKKAIYKVLFKKKRSRLRRSWEKHEFDRWHVENHIYNRPYKLQLAELLSDFKLDSVIEVGCGLGEILVHTKANRKVGYDIDPKVIKAASEMHRDITFKVGGLNDITEDSFDCLLLFNWIHDVCESELENSVNQYIGKVKYIIVDQIKKDTKGYLYYHTFDFLTFNFTLIEKLDTEKGIRNILIFRSHF